MSPKVSPKVSEEVSPTVAGATPEAVADGVSPGVPKMEKAGICSVASTVYKVALPMSSLAIHFWDSKTRR